jgi:hypothetical protein
MCGCSTVFELLSSNNRVASALLPDDFMGSRKEEGIQKEEGQRQRATARGVI